VGGELTILDTILANLAKSDLSTWPSCRLSRTIAKRSPIPCSARPRVELIDRPFDRSAPTRCGWRGRVADGALLVNGDTVHPIEVEQTVLAASHAAPRRTCFLPWT
jgi:hypothetical protein